MSSTSSGTVGERSISAECRLPSLTANPTSPAALLLNDSPIQLLFMIIVIVVDDKFGYSEERGPNTNLFE